jgi:hypothetical protein
MHVKLRHDFDSGWRIRRLLPFHPQELCCHIVNFIERCTQPYERWAVVAIPLVAEQI